MGYENCDLFVHGHGRRPLAERLRAMADWAETHGGDDMYGRGTAIGALESKVAALLGKPAALFAPSGTMVQQIALRIWADRSGCSHFGIQPTSHLDVHEHRGYAVLHGLHATLIGDSVGVLGVADLERCGQPLSTVVLELPSRTIGGQQPRLEVLSQLASVAKERGSRMHLDGARLWESSAGYGCPPAEICAHFDSVYVSVYKGVGALAGALLAGPVDFIEEARVWLRRHGGNLPSMAPFVVETSMRLDRALERMPAYVQRAREIAPMFTAISDVHVVPSPPQTNLFHVHFVGDLESWKAKRDAVAQQTNVLVFGHLRPTSLGCATEIYIGDGALDGDLERIRDAIRTLGQVR